MTTQLYAVDGIGTWHAVAHCDEFSRDVIGRCKYRFTPAQPQIEKRPHPDVYCAGCLGVEEREAKIQQTNTIFTGSTPKKADTETHQQG